MALISRFVSALRQAARTSEPPLLSARAGAAPWMPAFCYARRGMAGSKLFVGGLSCSTDEGTLKKAFLSYGEVVEAKVLIDWATGKSKGVGFVQYTNEEDAEAALEAMNGQMVAGKTVRVAYAIEKPRGSTREFGGPGDENVKRNKFGFVKKDNLEDSTTPLDQNADTNYAGIFGNKSHEEGNVHEALSMGGWQRF